MKKSGWTDQVACPNEECEVDIDVAYSPGYSPSPTSTTSRDSAAFSDPGSPDDIDTPDECPVCGYEITDRDRDRWCDELREERRDRGDRY